MKKTKFSESIDQIWVSKPFKTMRLTLLIFIIAAHCVVGSESYSQNTQLSLNMQNAAVEDVLKQIENNSEFSFLYSNKLIDVQRKVNVSVDQEQIRDVLDLMFKGSDVSYLVIDRHIVLSPKTKTSQRQDKEQESVEVSGTVISAETEKPLPGVSIIEKGNETNGTTTNMSGHYSITLPEDATLVFTFVGYHKKEVPVDGRNTINVRLRPSVQELEEVVVIGYGTQKKRDLTGSVASVETDDLQDIPAHSVDGLLQGRSAGVQVRNTSERPGASSVVRIRGESSLRGNNAPLVVVDGFPLGSAGNLKQINPDNIQSIEILKDASASAIYGSRGANGVIMITTKDAGKGEFQVSLTQQTTISEFTSKLNVTRDPVQMALLNNEARSNGEGYAPRYIGQEDVNGVYYPSVMELRTGEWPYNTDWPDVVFRDAPITEDLTASINASTEDTKYNLSMNYLDQQGIYKGDDYKKFNVNLSVDKTLTENIQVSTSNILSRGLQYRTRGTSYNRNPIFPVYEEDGDYFLYSDRDYYHPVARRENSKNQTKTVDFISSLKLDWDLLDVLTFTSQANYKYGAYVSDSYQPSEYTYIGDMNNGAANISNWHAHDLVVDNHLTYNNEFGVHDLKVMLGHSFEFHKNRTSTLQAFDFVNETLMNENLSAGDSELNQVSNDLNQHRLVSGFTRINYTLMDKYLLTFTSRMDGSSKFGADNKWAFFPSGAVSWKLHEENFLANVDELDQLKLRYSYGVSGNQGISPYQSLSRYGNDQYFVAGQWETAIGPGTPVAYDYYGVKYWGGMANPDLKWETTAQSNIGMDMALFDNRVALTLDMYKKHTKDLLREKFIAPSGGFDKMWINDGEIINKGFEAKLDLRILQAKDYSLSTSLIYSQNESEVVSLGDAVEVGLQENERTGTQYEFWGADIGDEFRQTYANILAIGEPINVFYGYRVDGIIQSKQEGLEAGLTGVEAEPGEFKYVDLNDDGEITPADREIIGDPNPDFRSSMSINASYKNFDLSLFFNGVFGFDVFNTDKFQRPSDRPLRWTVDNPTNEYPKLRTGRRTRFSDYYLQNVSFVRLQNVTLGYNFQIPNLEYFQNGRIYVNATQLFTLTNFNGYDPEVGMNGIYYSGIPNLRKITLGLDLKF